MGKHKKLNLEEEFKNAIQYLNKTDRALAIGFKDSGNTDALKVLIRTALEKVLKKGTDVTQMTHLQFLSLIVETMYPTEDENDDDDGYDVYGFND